MDGWMGHPLGHGEIWFRLLLPLHCATRAIEWNQVGGTLESLCALCALLLQGAEEASMSLLQKENVEISRFVRNFFISNWMLKGRSLLLLHTFL